MVVFLTLSWAGNQHLPKIKLKDLDNKRQNLSQYYSEGPILLNFWNLACEPCKKEMKFLDEYNKKYSKEGFKVLSINTDNSRTINRVKPFIKSKNYSFTVLNDPKSLFFRKLGGKVCPFLVLVDDKGNIVKKHTGYNPGDEVKLELEIQDMLKTSKVDSVSSDSSKVEAVSSDSSKVELIKEVETDPDPPSSEEQ